MGNAPAILTAAPEQREILRLALADAVYYRDPPQDCAVCPSDDELCDDCAARLDRALAYLELSKELGLEPSSPQPAGTHGRGAPSAPDHPQPGP
jgi:hypothetical protein